MSIIAKHYMSNFEDFDSMVVWLSSYHVYYSYRKQLDVCWKAFQKHQGLSDEHRLDYRITVFINPAGKFTLSIERRIRKKL